MTKPLMPAPFGASMKPRPKLEPLAKEPKPQEPEPEPLVEAPPSLGDALSYLYAKSVDQLAKETKLPKAKIKKQIAVLMDRDYLDEHKGFYRYQNTSPWKVLR